MTEPLALTTVDHWVSGLNPTEGGILSEPKWQFVAQSPLCSSFRHPDVTEILLKRM